MGDTDTVSGRLERRSTVGHGRVTRILATGGILGPLLYAIVLVALGSLRPGYSHAAQLASELGESGAPNAILMNGMFVAFGLLTIGLAIGLRRALGGGPAATAGAALVGAFGAFAAVGGGLFPCDPGCPVPGETLPGTMHTILGSIGFLSLATAPLVLGLSFRSGGRWSPLAIYSLVSSLVGLSAFFVLASGAWDAWRGAVQRVMVGVLYGWMLVIGTQLIRLTKTSAPA